MTSPLQRKLPALPPPTHRNQSFSHPLRNRPPLPQTPQIQSPNPLANAMLQHISRPLPLPLNMPHAPMQRHPLHTAIINPTMQNVTIIKHNVPRPQHHSQLPWHIPPFRGRTPLSLRPRAHMRPRHDNKRPIPITQREVPLRVERRPLQRSQFFLPNHGGRDVVTVPGEGERRNFLA